MKNYPLIKTLCGVFFLLLASTQESKSREPENNGSNNPTLSKFSQTVQQTKNTINLDVIKRNLCSGQYMSRGRFWGWGLVLFGGVIAEKDYLTTKANKYLGAGLVGTGVTFVFLTPNRMPQKIFLGLLIASGVANYLHDHWEKGDIEKKPGAWLLNQILTR